jgi:Cytochrome P460
MRRVFFLTVVFSFGIFGCSSGQPRISAIVNQNASLAGNLPANPLQWKVITSALDQAGATMSTLYGNDAAVDYVRTHSQHEFPTGSVVSLVTWTQCADPRWFGARIPEQVKSVEFVTVGATSDGQTTFSYELYTGTPLKMSSARISATPDERAAYLLAQRAAVMP